MTAIEYKGVKINIVDTPGHADFGGEVERTLKMVDGVLLLVDASEGPLPQTRFVVSKALKRGLRPIVAINKIDRPDERHNEVVNEAFDLFAALDANDEQLDFPILYGSAREGWMALSPDGPKDGMAPLFDLVLSHVPEPTIEEGPFRLLATTLEYDSYLGRILTGRITSGRVKSGQTVRALSRDGKVVETARVTKVLAFRGIERQGIDVGEAGDIVAIAGLTDATVADTIADPEITEPIYSQPVDPPTLAMLFRINDGPLAGKDGDKVQSRVIRARLMNETERNVAIRVRDTAEAEAFEVAGRGELQLGDPDRDHAPGRLRGDGLATAGSSSKRTRKRDSASSPSRKSSSTSTKAIPVSSCRNSPSAGASSWRCGPPAAGWSRLVLRVPMRGLIGYQSELLSDTRGTAVMNRLFHSYQPFKGELPGRRTGVRTPTATARRWPTRCSTWRIADG